MFKQWHRLLCIRCNAPVTQPPVDFFQKISENIRLLSFIGWSWSIHLNRLGCDATDFPPETRREAAELRSLHQRPRRVLEGWLFHFIPGVLEILPLGYTMFTVLLVVSLEVFLFPLSFFGLDAGCWWDHQRLQRLQMNWPVPKPIQQLPYTWADGRWVCAAPVRARRCWQFSSSRMKVCSDGCHT